MNVLLLASFFLSALVVAVGAIGLPWFLHKRLEVSWKWWGLGMAVFLIFQVVLRIPWVVALPQIGAFREWLKPMTHQWIWIVALCATAGLFEEGGRWIGYRCWFKPEDRVWKNALMFGAGHGGLEALGVALLQLTGGLTYFIMHTTDPARLGMPAERSREVLAQFAALAGWEPLLGLGERLGSLMIHLALSVMVLQAFRGRPAWLPLAMLAHTLANLTVVGAMVSLQAAGWTTAAKIVPQTLVALLVMAAYGTIRALREAPAKPGRSGEP